MQSDHKTRSARDSTVDVGPRELRPAKATHTLSVNVAQPKAAERSSGVDPYNTSGSFDRKKNWARVGKR
jgi:hypothetical protein